MRSAGRSSESREGNRERAARFVCRVQLRDRLESRARPEIRATTRARVEASETAHDARLAARLSVGNQVSAQLLIFPGTDRAKIRVAAVPERATIVLRRAKPRGQIASRLYVPLPQFPVRAIRIGRANKSRSERAEWLNAQ